jgi:hypothetical protein
VKSDGSPIGYAKKNRGPAADLIRPRRRETHEPRQHGREDERDEHEQFPTAEVSAGASPVSSSAMFESSTGAASLLAHTKAVLRKRRARAAF